MIHSRMELPPTPRWFVLLMILCFFLAGTIIFILGYVAHHLVAKVW